MKHLLAGIIFACVAVASRGQPVSFEGNIAVTGSVMVTNTITPGPEAISVTPSSRNFGNVTTNTTSDLTFTVQNTGGGTLSGTATVSTPFSVISGSPYAIGAGQTAVVTIRYSPTAIATNAETVTFTGGAGATPAVTGVGSQLPLPSDITSATLYRWLRADTTVYSDAGSTAATNDAKVQQWLDKSGNNRGVNQTLLAYRPTLHTNVLGTGFPGILFDASATTGMTNIAVETASAQPTTFYVVLQISPFTAADEVVFDGLTLANRQMFKLAYTGGEHKADIFAGQDLVATAAEATNAVPIAFECYYSGASSYVMKNGTSIASGGNPGINSIAGLTLGKRYTSTLPFNGHVFEVVQFAGTLSAGDKVKMDGYLRDRYGISFP
jgi:hypothetical protein